MNNRTALTGFLVVLTIVLGTTAVYESTIRTTTTSTVTSTMVTTVSTIPSAYGQVAVAYENHLLDLEAINASNFLGGYEENATVQWTGVSGGCDGNYSGLSEFGPLFGALMSDQQHLVITNETQSIRPAGQNWVVDSTIHLVANSTGDKSITSPYAGVSVMTIEVQDSYAKSGGGWVIFHETWNFLYFVNSIIERPLAPTCQG